jgi:hypothetical protein
MTVTYMTDGSPKSWDKKLRTYEVTYPSGQKVLWQNFTARDCLTKYEGHQSMYNNELKIREIVGKELQLQKIIDK